MANVAIPYFSGRGHTRRLAQEIAAGLGVGHCDARLIDVAQMGETDWQALDAADAIVMGTPTYMGSAAAEFKAFMDQTGTLWAQQRWAISWRQGSPWPFLAVGTNCKPCSS